MLGCGRPAPAPVPRTDPDDAATAASIAAAAEAGDAWHRRRDRRTRLAGLLGILVASALAVVLWRWRPGSAAPCALVAATAAAHLALGVRDLARGGGRSWLLDFWAFALLGVQVATSIATAF